MYERIVCALGMSPAERSFHILDKSTELLSSEGTLYLTHAVEELSPDVIGHPRATKILSDAELKLTGLRRRIAVPCVLRVRPGSAAQVILDVANEVAADLIVMSASQYGILDKLFGSTVDKVMHEAGCSILICR